MPDFVYIFGLFVGVMTLCVVLSLPIGWLARWCVDRGYSMIVYLVPAILYGSVLLTVAYVLSHRLLTT